MNKANPINSFGPAYSLLPLADEFIRTWPGEKPRLSVADVCALIKIATNPHCVLPAGFTKADGLLPGEVDAYWFASRYAIAPEFLCKFLLKLRARWFKDSKRQRIQNFLCSDSLTFTTHHGRERVGHDYFNKELTDLFNSKNSATGKNVASEKDIESARRELSKLQKASERAITSLEKMSIPRILKKQNKA